MSDSASTPGGKKARQEAALAALLSEPTHAAAADKAGIGVATLRRWLKLPGFRKAYLDARRQLVDSALAQLQRASGQAVEALVRNLSSGRAGDEIRAALGIIEHATKGVEIGDMAERIEELEKLLAEVLQEKDNHVDEQEPHSET